MDQIDLGFFGTVIEDVDESRTPVVAVAEIVEISGEEYAVVLRSGGKYWLSPVGGNA